MAKAAAKTPAPTALAVPSAQDANILELAGNAATQLVVAENYQIDSREMYEIAAASLSDIAAAAKQVEAMRTSVSEPLHKAWKNTNALFKPIGDKLDQAKRLLGRKMVEFENKERARVQAAEQAALLQRQRDMETSSAHLHEVTRRFDMGDATVEDVQAAAAEALIAEVALPVAPTEDRLDRGGHARVTRWKVAEITDAPALLRWLADKLAAGDTTFNNTVEFKLGQLNAFAQATSGSVPVPGVRFEQDASISARS